MEKHHKFSIWYVILGIWVVLIFQNLLFSMFEVKTIPFSQFLTLLKENKVKEVAITNDRIQGKIVTETGKENQEQFFRNVRVDPDTYKLLEQYNVTFSGKIASKFFQTLLSWVLPVLLFFGVWYFLIKRMTAQQPGFMTLGKNKAKIYVQDELNVSFDDVAGVDEAKQELGHALVALSLPGTEPVQKISIIPRGVAALGYTMQRPTEDRYLMKKTELENRIATLLGGRAAEKIIFDDVSTGAHNDLSRATDIARSMVKEYGMSDVVGQVYFAQEKHAKFLEMMPEGTADYSEVTAESIDGEIKAIIQTQ